MSVHLFPNEKQLCAAKILIVDDEAADIRVLEWMLRRVRFPNFRSVTDSTQARKIFLQFRPDLVLLDLFMPQLDGFGVLEQIRESAPAGEFLPVLIFTGQNTAEMRTKAIAAGANDFLGKPIDYTEVMLRIRNLLQTRFLHQRAREMEEQLEIIPTAKQTDSPVETAA
jgi:putative two-component system response regulator